MNVLISIKPKYVVQILNGVKKCEFRKRIPKNFDIETDMFYIYCSSPVKKIVGCFSISRIIYCSIFKLYNSFLMISGITYEEFAKYFEGKYKGYVIFIKKVIQFDEYIEPKKINPYFVAPQSFYYINDAFIFQYFGGN